MSSKITFLRRTEIANYSGKIIGTSFPFELPKKKTPPDLNINKDNENLISIIFKKDVRKSVSDILEWEIFM